MKTLSDYKEQISDAFQSTFTVINPYAMRNLALPTEFAEISEICKSFGFDVQVIPIQNIGPKYHVLILQTKELT